MNDIAVCIVIDKIGYGLWAICDAIYPRQELNKTIMRAILLLPGGTVVLWSSKMTHERHHPLRILSAGSEYVFDDDLAFLNTI